MNLIFVPPYPGSPFSPIPLGTAIGMGLDGSTTSQVTVNSATINANTEVEAVTDPNTGKPANGPPPAGDQYTLVNLTLTYVQGVLPLLTLSPGDWPLDQIAAEGAPLGVYDVEDNPDTCVPPAPDLGAAEALSTGQTETGNLCFTIASTDASTLLLRAIDNIYWKVPRYIFLALR